MKTLYIIRHAKSDWDDPSLSDFERPLNKRGQKNAPFMGKILAKNHVHPDIILSSPALRAKSTAKFIAEEIGYDTKKIVYEGDLYLADRVVIEQILKKIPPLFTTAFVIGHNPGLTLFAEYISGCEVNNIPTAGIIAVRLKYDDWKSLGKESVDVVFFDYPKKHRHGIDAHDFTTL